MINTGQNTTVGSISDVLSSDLYQTTHFDYTGVFAFCIIAFVLGLLLIATINFWIAKIYSCYKNRCDEEINFIKEFYKTLEEKVKRMNDINEEIIGDLKNGVQ